MLKSLIDNKWPSSISTFAPSICYNMSNEKENEEKVMEQHLIELGIRLAEIGAKNTATAIADKIRASKAANNDKKTIAEMTELIYELLDEKQELEIIAKSYQDELVAQKLTEDDLNFVVQTVIPSVKDFMEKISGSDTEALRNMQNVEALEPLMSLNMLRVLQTLGFNYKKGIGEPLTKLTNGLISGKNKENQTHINELIAERDLEFFKLLQNDQAFERYSNLKK